MIMIRNRLRKAELFDVKIINQVHDSIVLDAPKKDVDETCIICYNVLRGMGQSIKDYWNYDWKVPLDGECKVGYNWMEMEKYKLNI